MFNMCATHLIDHQSIEAARDGLQGFTKGSICSLEVRKPQMRSKALGTVPGTGTRTGYGGTAYPTIFLPYRATMSFSL